MGHFSPCVYSDGANDNDVDFVISDKLIISLLTIISLSQPLFRASLNNLRIAISLPIQLFRPNSRQFAGSEKLVQPPLNTGSGKDCSMLVAAGLNCIFNPSFVTLPTTSLLSFVCHQFSF